MVVVFLCVASVEKSPDPYVGVIDKRYYLLRYCTTRILIKSRCEPAWCTHASWSGKMHLNRWATPPPRAHVLGIEEGRRHIN
jgi:hypothetical protein